jgi:succinate dehydrogenase / fumarate reductase cytochrome b subunit
MSATAAQPHLFRAARFYEATIGKKVVMAITGVILFGFIIGHLLGNLQIFLGREKIDAYGEFLHRTPAVLWSARIVLLVSVILHVTASIQLTLLKWRARPVKYAKKDSVGSTYASRTMMWSGPIIFTFVIYHLLHFTFGTVHPAFEPGKVYDNMVIGFRQVPVSLAYIAAMVFLGFHLQHGVWSMFQSIGVAHPRYTRVLQTFARVATVLIVIGNISIPVAVMTGIVSL